MRPATLRLVYLGNSSPLKALAGNFLAHPAGAAPGGAARHRVRGQPGCLG
jgi:hypothetical protein